MPTASSFLRQRAPRRGKRSLLPQIAPMLAVASDLPADEAQFGFEYKWDGMRAIAYHQGASLGLKSRTGRDITSHFPELHAMACALGAADSILDGEIIAFDAEGRPSFARLQERMHIAHPSQRLLASTPVWYVVFDLLFSKGSLLLNQTYEDRRRLLERVVKPGNSWRVTPASAGGGSAMLNTARAHGLEGVVAKRLTSVYEPGRRSPAWLKIKVVQRQEFVIGGWIPQLSSGPVRIGSLLLGYHDDDGSLRFAGGVGTGFNETEHQRLTRLLKPMARRQSPFADAVPKQKAQYVVPKLVAEVEYRRWPEGGSLQQGAYKGLREDKDAREVVKEHP